MEDNIKLIWLDKKINGSENKYYQSIFTSMMKKCIFLDNIDLNKDDDLQIFKSAPHNIVLAGTTWAQQLVQKIDEKVIIFCGNHLSHIELFLNNTKIQTIISSGIEEVLEQINKQKEFIVASELLKQQFISKPLQQSQYQHSNEAIGFNFLFINEKLKNNIQISEDNINDELKALLNEKVYQHLLNQPLHENLDLFEKLLYYYTIEYYDREIPSFYKMLNQQLTKCQYGNISNIICVLFKGFSKIQYNASNSIKKVYRGVPFEKNQFDQIMINFQEQKSFFWNHLTSTSLWEAFAEDFITDSQKQFSYGILFEIELDTTKPHPNCKLEYSRYPEQEVLLFPQFEFTIHEKKEEYQLKGKKIVRILIKQKVNDFSMALDQNKREQFWIDRINTQFRPQLKKIVEFYKSRIHYLIRLFRNKEQLQYINDTSQEFKNEVDNYFQEITAFLTTLVDEKESIEEYYQALKSILDFQFIITDNFLNNFEQELSIITDCLTEEFIKIIKKACNIQEFYQTITKECNQFAGWHVQNGIIGGTVMAMPQNIPFVGYAFQIDSLCLDKLLTKLETFEEITRVGVKTATNVTGFWAGTEGGASLGVPFGPYGMIAGGLIGGFLGGVGAVLLGRGIDQIGKFEIKVHFSEKNKSKIKNGYIISPGINPQIDIKHVRKKTQSLILLAETTKSLSWVVCNISPETTQIKENSRLSKKTLGYNYIGPTSEHKEITFHLIGITQKGINEQSVLEDMNQDKFTVVCKTKTVVKL